MGELADSGVLIATEEVLEELGREDTEVQQWAEEHGAMFLPLDEVTQQRARDILRSHPNLIDLKKRRSGADPFVIATATINGSAIVTEEKPSGGPPKVKIPDVCRVYGIECIALLELLRREGVRL